MRWDTACVWLRSLRLSLSLLERLKRSSVIIRRSAVCLSSLSLPLRQGGLPPVPLTSICGNPSTLPMFYNVLLLYWSPTPSLLPPPPLRAQRQRAAWCWGCLWGCQGPTSIRPLGFPPPRGSGGRGWGGQAGEPSSQSQSSTRGPVLKRRAQTIGNCPPPAARRQLRWESLWER